LPVVLYGCKAWSVTKREKHKLRACGNRVLRRIFGPKREEITGEWRKLHTGSVVIGVLTKYYSDDEINKNEMEEGVM